ncbi:hypothetical protein [Halomarina pelagica]|uniref:hypothetical protein n=1 Tax=Halomarina pelagica TaxID=2961599 RepID=UPI0020C3651E|nr:hypothetical protein [Halomarina sp. BND7]
MQFQRHQIRGLIVGRSLAVAVLFILLSGVISLAAVYIGTMFSLGSFVVFQSEVAQIVAGIFLLGLSVIHGYRNGGYLTCIVVPSIIAGGVLTSGGIATYGGEVPPHHIVIFALIFGFIFGTVGFILGVVLRKLS